MSSSSLNEAHCATKTASCQSLSALVCCRQTGVGVGGGVSRQTGCLSDRSPLRLPLHQSPLVRFGNQKTKEMFSIKKVPSACSHRRSLSCHPADVCASGQKPHPHPLRPQTRVTVLDSRDFSRPLHDCDTAYLRHRPSRVFIAKHQNSFVLVCLVSSWRK